jgi:hypothetical protein
VGKGHAPTDRPRRRRATSTVDASPADRDGPAGGAVPDSGSLTSRSALALQRRAGNAAVRSLLTAGRAVQRDALDPADDPQGYTQAGGRKVAGTGTTRVVVSGLKYGVKGGFAGRYGKRTSAESTMTKQSPDNTAVVIMPDTMAADRPVQVVLHFHGWGFRSGSDAQDPYAGYTVATGGPTPSQGAKGTVRDVDQEHWEQQIGAVARERGATGPQIVAVLAQGRGPSDFGNVPTFDYLQDVFAHVPALASIKDFTIVMSAHSGGGSTQVAPKVTGGDIRGSDRSTLPTPGKGRAPMQPSDLVVLFDAEGVESVTGWIEGLIRGLATSTKSDAAAQAAIAASPKFRGYFATRGSYWARYHAAAQRLESALASVPAQWRDPDSADPTAVRVRDLFRFIEVTAAGVNHEHVISGGKGGATEAGSLADSLRASLDPTIDRARSYDPKEGGKRLAAWQKEVAAWRAAQAEKQRKAKEAAERAKAKASGPTAPAPVQKLAAAGPAFLPVQRVPATAPAAPAPVQRAAWKASDATGEYALTADDRALLAGSTADARQADRTALTKAALRRLAKLTAAEKRNKLKAGEDQELADLRTLKDRVETTNRALGRQDVEDVIADAGLGTVAQWFGDVQQGTFLGVSLRVHKSLASRLTTAETALVNDATVNPGKANSQDLGRALNLYASTSDLRQPAKAVGGTSLSMHTFGLAVDLNYKGNPFIGNAGKLAPAVIRRATGLVLGTPTEVTTGLGDAAASFTTLKAASDALKTYLSYRDPANRAALTAAVTGHTAAPGEPTDVAGWLTQIELDHTELSAGGDFDKHKPPEEGFLDLDRAVVLALTGAGLTWGGTYPGAKDLMHFDLRQGDGGKIQTARTAHTAHR